MPRVRNIVPVTQVGDRLPGTERPSDQEAPMSGGMRPAVVERLGERIRAARQELDLSVGALAEASEVSRRKIGRASCRERV